MEKEPASTHIDGAHALLYSDRKGHDGACITTGTGNVYVSSTKSDINTVSSRQTKAISVGKKLSKYLGFRNFAAEQSGDPSQVHVLYHDNNSSIVLQNNVTLSCGKGSKHIHIRYFFITDQIKQRSELNVTPLEIV